MRPVLTPRWSQLRRPVIPPKIFLPHRIRSFHATRPAAIFPELVTAAAGYLHGVHAVTGLPWVASIPVAALGVRTLVSFFLVWQRISTRRQADLKPLIECVKKHYQDAIRAKAVRDSLYMRPQDAQKELSRELKKKTAALYKEWKINKWTPFVLPFVQIPVFLSLMEAMRHICGVNNGLLRFLVPIPDKDGVSSISLPGVEPSLASEGALWFPDLLAGDPTGILPIALGITIITNVRIFFQLKSAAEVSDESKRKMLIYTVGWIMKTSLTFMGAWIALTAWVTGMPAGMMLYWIVSTNIAMIQNKLLDKYLFVSSSLRTLPRMHVRVLKPGEKRPPTKSMDAP